MKTAKTGERNKEESLKKERKDVFRIHMRSRLTLYWAAMALAVFTGVLLLTGIGTRHVLMDQYRIWMNGAILLFLLMLLISGFLVWHFITSMNGLIEEIRQDVQADEKYSGIFGFDELPDYLPEKEEKKEEGELPPDIEELFSEFTERVGTLTPMERTVLQYYIDGCSIEEVAARAYISVNTVKKHNTNINRKLGVSTREEMMLYIDLFRRCGRLDEITYQIQ